MSTTTHSTDADGYGRQGGYGLGGYGGSVIMTKTATVTLVLEERGELQVQVNASDTGAGVEGASVTLETVDGSVSESATTDATGLVVFDGVEVQGYQLTASKTGWFDATGSVAAGDFS